VAKSKVPSTNGHVNVSAEDFVRAWQVSSNVSEVATRTGLSKVACTGRAQQMRKHNVPLKKFGRATKVDYDAMRELAVSLAE